MNDLICISDDELIDLWRRSVSKYRETLLEIEEKFYILSKSKKEIDSLHSELKSRNIDLKTYGE